MKNKYQIILAYNKPYYSNLIFIKHKKSTYAARLNIHYSTHMAWKLIETSNNRATTVHIFSSYLFERIESIARTRTAWAIGKHKP